MRLTYTPQAHPGTEFEIEADRHGSYAIRLNGKVIRRVTALADYVGKPKWGSRKLEAGAIEDAKRDIEAFVARTTEIR
ncbi:MAG: hypothetical protein ACYC0T_02095 [Ramlibacter sp.]